MSIGILLVYYDTRFDTKIMTMGKYDFADWLNQELNNRDWKPADLAKKAGLASGILSRILNRERNAGTETCNAIAQALKIPAEVVFRHAGLLPPKPEMDSLLEECIFIFDSLPESDKEEILEIARLKLSLKERRGGYEAGKKNLDNHATEAGSQG